MLITYYRNVTEFVELMVRLGDAMGCVIQRPRLFPLANDRTATFVDGCNKAICDTTQVIIII